MNDDKECKQPVCWSGDDENKSCYICEYGTLNQHIVCSSKGSQKDKEYNAIQDRNKDKNECPAPSEMQHDKSKPKFQSK